MLSAGVPPQAVRGSNTTHRVYALHGPDAALELNMLAAVATLTSSSFPLLPALLGRRSPAPDSGAALTRWTQPPTEKSISVGTLAVFPEPEGGQAQSSVHAEDMGSGSGTDAAIEAALADAMQTWSLNDEQQEILRSVGVWFGPTPEVRALILTPYTPLDICLHRYCLGQWDWVTVSALCMAEGRGLMF